MEIKFLNKELNQLILKYQEGGVAPEAAPVQEAAPAPLLGGSPEEQLMMACQLAIETQDCQLAIQVCLAVLQMMGGGAPTEAPAGQEPVYRKGGTLKYWKNK